MDLNFYTFVETRLSSFLQSKGMKLKECRELDNGRTSALFYESTICKIAVFKSLIDGEINFKIAPATASNADLNDNTRWFFSSFLKNEDKNLPLEALLARVPESPKGSEEQLDQIALDLKSNFDDLVIAMPNCKDSMNSAG